MKSPKRQRAKRALAAFLASGMIACESVEPYVAEAITFTGTLVKVAAAIYAPQYGQAASILMDSFTQVGVSAATTWVDRRREQRLQEALARLDQLEAQALEAQMEAQYARLDNQYEVPVQDPSASWGTADPPGGTWGSVYDQGTSSYTPPADSTLVASAQPTAAAVDPANPWGERYMVKGVPPVIQTRSGEPAPLGLDVALLKRSVDADGVEHAVPFESGATLRDGHGRPEEGDALRVYFSPSKDAYVYVVAVDAVARVQPLHPFELPPGRPVPAGAQVVLPSPDDWYGLDEYRGLQHVFFIASEEPLRDIEAQLYYFASQPLPTPQKEGARVTEPTVIEGDRSEIEARGLTNVVPPRIVEVPSGASRVDSIETEHFHAETADGAVVVTRFFNHN